MAAGTSVADPAQQEDLEKLHERSLLQEFQEYAQGKGRLQVFCTEAGYPLHLVQAR